MFTNVCEFTNYQRHLTQKFDFYLVYDVHEVGNNYYMATITIINWQKSKTQVTGAIQQDYHNVEVAFM